MKMSYMPDETRTEASRRWMIVDDNPEVLQLLRRTAELYTDNEIECFEGPFSALAAFEAEPDAFELVITDLEMPVMNGEELCRRVRQRSPGVKVVLVTGCWGSGEEEVAHKGFCGLLQKPFAITDFARVLACASIGKIGLTLATLMAA